MSDTMDRTQALDALIEAVEAGKAKHVYFAAAFQGYTMLDNLTNAYHGSLDAALSLHEALLPGWFPGMSKNIHNKLWYAWVQDKDNVQYWALEPTPARAWLLAVLRAYRATITPPTP